MQEGNINMDYKRSGEDRRKVHTFLLHERRLGPFCRRHANAIINERKNAPKYWDWQLEQWRPLPGPHHCKSLSRRVKKMA